MKSRNDWITVSKLNQEGFVTSSSPVEGTTYPLYAMLSRPGADFTFGQEPFRTHFLVTDTVTWK